ncbi:MAG: hypothetical protein GF320_21365 [Armatimonadia bacterium]|nr:hypothetical protein [Armatimonadia bacterium]
MAYSELSAVKERLRTFLNLGDASAWGDLTSPEIDARIGAYQTRADDEINLRLAGRMRVTDAATSGIRELAELLTLVKICGDEFAGRGRTPAQEELAVWWRQEAERMFGALLDLERDEIAHADGLDVPGLADSEKPIVVTSDPKRVWP